MTSISKCSSPEYDGNHVIVVDYEGNLLKKINGQTRASGLALDASADRLYVGRFADPHIGVIDTATLKEKPPLSTFSGWSHRPHAH